MIVGAKQEPRATSAQRSHLLELLEKNGFDRDRVNVAITAHRILKCEAPIGSSVESWVAKLSVSRASKLIAYLREEA